MLKDVQLTVIGKVFKPNRRKVLALNRCLEEYHRLVKWYLSLNSTSKNWLHREAYEKARARFNLSSALIQTARDKAVEALKSFRETRRKRSQLNLRRVSIRFDGRCYSFSQTTNALTPWWLTLTLNNERISLPIVYGEKQEELIRSALAGEYAFRTVEMVKRSGAWYAHIVIKRTVELKEPETVVGLDMGEVNLVTAVALVDGRPSKGRFWRGSETKRVRGLYNHIRRRLGEKRLPGKIRELGARERRRVNQQLHIIANEVVAYARQFPAPAIAMEDLNGLKEDMRFSRRMNRRVHSMPYRRLQKYIEYKANLEGIDVRYVERAYTSMTCHRCGHVARADGREFRCPECGLEYDRDLNAAINIARRLKRSAGWGSRDTPEPADEAAGAKPRTNAGTSATLPNGSPALKGGEDVTECYENAGVQKYSYLQALLGSDDL